MKRPPGRKARIWTEGDDAVLDAQWRSTMTIDEIARHHNRSATSIRRRADALGITEARPGFEISVSRVERMKASMEAGRISVPDYVKNRDDDYVAACLAQGGFSHGRVIDGRTVQIWPNLQGRKQALAALCTDLLKSCGQAISSQSQAISR